MDRREFTKQIGITGGAILLGGGLWGGMELRQALARSRLTDQLVGDASPVLASKALAELRNLPAKGSEEIRNYFHGRCLNVEGFVRAITAQSFQENIAVCATKDQQYEQLLAAFNRRVVADVEVLNRVQTIAREIGTELDSGWEACGKQVASKWSIPLKEYGTPLAFDDFSNHVERTIRQEMGEAVRQAWMTAEKPALGQTIGKIGESAIMLLPLVRYQKLGLAVGVPVFVLLALKHTFDYVVGQFSDHAKDCQAAISARLALLGNRVASEFEREIRQRIGTLHSWQENALRASARHQAEERISFI